VIPAIVLVSAQLFLAMRFVGSTASSDPAMLVGWGASLGTLTTNGGWWRLVTSTFVYSSTLHLVFSLAALIQVGRILERVVGRLTVIAVYLSAGIFTGLVNLSSHPLAVTVGTSGAVFGLYGLLIALLIWQTFHEWRGTFRTPVNAETSVSLSKAETAPYPQSTLLQHLDRPPLDGSVRSWRKTDSLRWTRRGVWILRRRNRLLRRGVRRSQLRLLKRGILRSKRRARRSPRGIRHLKRGGCRPKRGVRELKHGGRIQPNRQRPCRWWR
jgi:hypothetical protein